MTGVYAVLLSVGFVFVDPPKTSVGMMGRIEQLVLPGTELEVKPLTDRNEKIVLRIEAAYPHGSAYRYDLVYYGLEPGEYDLRHWLQRKDGSAVGELPRIPVRIESVLAPGHVLPNPTVARKSPFIGGYRWLLIAAGVLWFLGLLAILFVGRAKRHADSVEQRPITLADKLRPLVERGLAGKLTSEERASLERSLINYWKNRLRLGQAKPADVFATLRRNPDAGPLLAELEAWLHRPGGHQQVDVTELLRPYRDLPADALDAEVTA